MKYITVEITNPDGSKTLNITRIKPQTKMTEKQILTQKAIEAFGTSS